MPQTPQGPARKDRRPLKVELDVRHLLRLRVLKLCGRGDMRDHIEAALDLYFPSLGAEGEPGHAALLAMEAGLDVDRGGLGDAASAPGPQGFRAAME
ncbi:MAG: hypothetical protein LC624_08350 [Halobacteriales archaeon]|nr:hypothetical protein [Halobacteriales archaeon]